MAEVLQLTTTDISNKVSDDLSATRMKIVMVDKTVIAGLIGGR